MAFIVCLISFLGPIIAGIICYIHIEKQMERDCPGYKQGRSYYDEE